MSASADSVIALVEDELAKLDDRRVVGHIRGLLVTPELQMRAWDYGAPNTSYPCWLVLAHKASNTGIAYSEFGFGPAMPWGLLFLHGAEHMSMGMDSGWYQRFLGAYFESMAASDLPIWRVFRHQGNFPGIPITDESTWSTTWAEVERLRSEHPAFRYDCWQSVYVRDA
jgi:hypothetical protein